MSRCIAVVDDDHAVAEFLQELLADEGYEPVLWDRGAGAYELVKRLRPAAVLLDMNMETRDAGLRVAQAICHDPDTAGIPVIIISAEAEFLHKRHAELRALPCRIHPKPVDIPTLLSLLQELTESVATGMCA